MKTKLKLVQARMFCAVALGIGSCFILVPQRGTAADPAGPALTKTSIPWSQIGPKAGADYQGDGLAVSPTAEGARLRCGFQRLEGEATREGLWLTSTVTNGVSDRFRVVATALGRLDGAFGVPASAGLGSEALRHTGGAVAGPAKAGTPNQPLPRTGTVAIDGQSARFTRPGLTEEYTVSMDGVRQDFIIEQRPVGEGPLRVELAVSGARVEPAAGGARPVRYPQQIEEAEHGSSLSHGARLVLENSGRKIAYSRLRVTDATGKELTARMEVMKGLESRLQPAQLPNPLRTRSSCERPAKAGTPNGSLVVLVNDADAEYPVRIDPTFSDANWISMGGGIPGANREVYAAVVDVSGNLYIGGDFTVVGDVIAHNIAKWNGSSWTALGLGMDNVVFALAVSGSNLYAGGYFTTAGGSAATNIAKWNGSSWSALGSGMNYGLYALAVSGSNLYAGGQFTRAGGSRANYIAKWDGSTWTALGSGVGGGDPFGNDTYVHALAVSGSDLYAGGGFTTAGGISATNIARWNGSSWTALGSGMNDQVDALAVSGSDLYAGGYFSTAGGIAANRIAKWNGSSWSALGSGIGVVSYPYGVAALAVSGSDLYAGGTLFTAGGAATSIAKWDGSSWSALGSGMNDQVNALAVSGSDVYAGGFFTTMGGSAASSIAKWDGSSWSALGSDSGMDNVVHALAVSGSDLYAGGNFTTAGGSRANSIAKWDGSSWTALGSGMGGGNGLVPYVSALAVSGSDLYAGGNFTTAGGSAATNIAKWDGSSWSALGSGMDSYVDALAVSGSDLYAGGYFTTAGGSAANYIAKWDGSTWTALGSGMDSYVYALAVSGSDLYAGGGFTTAGGISATNIARWNGSSWSALGLGMDNVVLALAVSGSDVYAGGFFRTAGGSTANYIAKWDGSSWSALGSGMGAGYTFVHALAVSGSDLYAGGYFTTAGGSAATSIAKWDGSSWTALGSGMDNYVYALAVSGSDLYAGGNFLTAGGKGSAYLARAIVNPPVLVIEGDGDGGYFIRFSGVPGSAYRLQRAPGLSGPWAASGPQTAPASGLLEFWDLFPPPGQGFYRSVQP